MEGEQVENEDDIIYCNAGNSEKKNQEEIKKIVSEYLQSENLNFLLGAGCSSLIEKKEEQAIPTMKPLAEEFFNKNKDFKILGETANKYRDNLEKMLDIMNAIKTVGDIKEIDADIDNNINLVKNFIKDKVISGSKSDKMISVYKKFYEKISQRPRSNPINVFTTNYDIFNEMALDDLGFLYNDGFTGTYKRKFNPASYNYMYVDNMNLNKDAWEGISTFYNLIKLHGSITWYKDSTNDNTDDNIIEQSPEIKDASSTMMIYPTPLKDRTTLMTPYSDLFRYMENKLFKKNSTLITIGYGFNDAHINRIIYNALAVNSFQLLIFGDNKIDENLQKKNDTRITFINSKEKIHYFKNIVEEILPNIHPDIEENMLIKCSGKKIVLNCTNGETNE